MGASQSIGKLSHEKLFELTKDTRNVMNILLEYMLKEVSVRDFLSLSNPTECKKYVLFMANNLYKYFYELQIYPTKTKQGVLVFRKADELATPPDKSIEDEKQGLCLVLAFYYTRIFQIYGALALTLIDDIQLASKSGMMTVLASKQKRLLAPGQQQYYATAGDYSFLSLGYFIFLQSFLSRVTEDDYFVTKYSGTGTKSAKIYFKKQTMTDSSVQKGSFKINISDKTPSYVDLYAVKESNTIKIEFLPIRYYPKSSTVLKSIEIPNEILSSKIVNIQIIPRTNGRDSTYQIADTGQSISDFFNALFQRIVEYIRNLSKDDVKSTVESGIEEELRLSRTIQNLTKTKPLGHCVARALQLLQSQPFDDKTALSYICKAKFLESTATSSDGTKTVVTRSGIPEPGTSLDNSPGIAALSQLFYEIVYEATPKLAISEQKGTNGISAMDEYRLFMKNMAILFGDVNNRSPETLAADGIKGIKNRRDREACKKIGTTDSITIPNQTAKEVSQYVQQLFQLQLQHAAKCGAIFQKLFLIKRDKSSNGFKISLSDNIIKKGFPEIQRINTEARRLLVDYYSRCEDTYRQGMKRVFDYKASVIRPTGVVPVPSAPPSN